MSRRAIARRYLIRKREEVRRDAAATKIQARARVRLGEAVRAV